ncbi:MAG: nucleotidyltransferase family protein [Chloroflexi bacterium]|nr:nucleotidyltransferase family protein [Chloroflexota bacterium]
MSIRSRLPIDEDAVARFCQRWDISELALFGSVLREDFRPDSDVDVLVTFAPGAHPTLFDLAEMQDELHTIFGREVDLLTRRGVEKSRNRARREAILSSAQPLYVA